MKRCKYCSAELPDSANYCDVCGEACADTLSHKEYETKVHRRKMRKKVKIIIAVSIAALFGFLIFISICMTAMDNLGDHYYGRGEPEDWKNFVTAQQLEKVTFDMSYEDVTKVLGEGILEASYDKGDYKSYFWPGAYYTDERRGVEHFDSELTIVFTGGQMQSIEEENIIDGEEARKTFDTDFENLDTEIVTKDKAHRVKDDMDISLVNQLLGSKGALISSRSYRMSSGLNSRWKTYRWRCVTFDQPDAFDIEFYNGKVYYFYLGDYME